MIPDAIMAMFAQPVRAMSLYAYAPVFRVTEAAGDWGARDWVVKRTGLAGSSGAAIGDWLAGLDRAGVRVVVPVPRFAPNPRTLDNGETWVVYPFVEGEPYRADRAQIAAAGALLGRIHAADPPAALADRATVVVKAHAWIARHLASAITAMTRAGHDASPLRHTVAACLARVGKDDAESFGPLPLVGASVDFKASNIVFADEAVLIDPDHAARIPRLLDLAIAVLLFHNDVPGAPHRLWTAQEWRTFADGYACLVTLTSDERRHWRRVLDLAWLDQGLWLLGNFPEGWDDPDEARYLAALVAFDATTFALP